MACIATELLQVRETSGGRTLANSSIRHHTTASVFLDVSLPRQFHHACPQGACQSETNRRSGTMQNGLPFVPGR